MFEKYNEKARRSLFFSRYEASKLGSRTIEPEHILLGLVREGGEAVSTIFQRFEVQGEDLRREVQGDRVLVVEQISSTDSLPLSEDSKKILAYAAHEADSLLHANVGPGHLIIGVLRVEGCAAARILAERKFDIDIVREVLVAAHREAEENARRENSGVLLDAFWRKTIWQQFGAAIDMLGNAIDACPAEAWADESRQPELWYLAYHTLFFLDLYLHGTADGFAPPEPFTLSELDPEGRPERPYTKEELRTYLDHCRKKCRETIDALTEGGARRRCGIEWLDLSGVELQLYNMRHVQHHAAQMNLLLRERTGSAPGWVRVARE